MGSQPQLRVVQSAAGASTATKPPVFEPTNTKPIGGATKDSRYADRLDNYKKSLGYLEELRKTAQAYRDDLITRECVNLTAFSTLLLEKFNPTEVTEAKVVTEASLGGVVKDWDGRLEHWKELLTYLQQIRYATWGHTNKYNKTEAHPDPLVEPEGMRAEIFGNFLVTLAKESARALDEFLQSFSAAP